MNNLVEMWEFQLDEIEHGRADAKTFMRKVEQYATGIVEEAKTLKVGAIDFEESLGNCPGCGEPIRQSEKRYFCSSASGCTFYIWKTQYFKNVTPKMLAMLLTKKKTNTLSFKSKTGTYKAVLTLEMPVTEGQLVRVFK
ncbi:hypothetical protein HMPREF1210_02145 [Paenisporosarcina sp. HGH0030]|uniref:hypothetical protein n=1 Tax=Paenisporosarcina sp. HGH0030 TaxID=1078085 RepID=UPI00034E9FE5|nr:hypothetical protein [Paenisporosarcina sp. HGH0030]EPD51547.1 hypothetical protein HMPREF1210_02145 [Paenisporosarcina sp. HGH0030]